MPIPIYRVTTNDLKNAIQALDDIEDLRTGIQAESGDSCVSGIRSGPTSEYADTKLPGRTAPAENFASAFQLSTFFTRQSPIAKLCTIQSDNLNNDSRQNTCDAGRWPSGRRACCLRGSDTARPGASPGAAEAQPNLWHNTFFNLTPIGSKRLCDYKTYPGGYPRQRKRQLAWCCVGDHCRLCYWASHCVVGPARIDWRKCRHAP